ncbi:hypothetical protein BsWGS_25104 [Bradybaena similaris]
MAKKKGEIQLQREIETQEEWEEVMAMEGLWVVDVYQEWCGPCLALLGTFRRLKNELGDNLLNFAMAKADTIDALEKYRGRCEPSFLFYAGGILTSYIHGADAPKVQKVITEQLASEHKILEGTGERKEVKDPVITREQEKLIERQAEEEALRIAEETVGFTIAIIKPDAVAQGKVDEIIAEIKASEINILAQQEREITEEEAAVIYSSLDKEPYFDELIRYICSGPSYVLLLSVGESGATTIKDWKELLGPSNVEEAKEQAPSSLRARFGDNRFMNALHGSATKDAAAREQALFFPTFHLPTFQQKRENIQWTLAILRPELFATKKSAVLEKIAALGFKIIMYKETQMSKDQAAEFYKEHEQFAYFDSLVDTMSSGPFLALTLSKDEAIKAFKKALGPSNIDEAIEKAPKSLRAQFPGTGGWNQIHGSDSEETAKAEIAYFFPMEQTFAVIKPHAMNVKDEIVAEILRAGFKIAVSKETTIIPEAADTLYSHQRDSPFYDDLINSMTSGPALFMVLSREGALAGWRLEIGDVDPEVAKATNPDSLRAQFGTSILNNAVHGSSSHSRAKQEIREIFGDLAFSEDGTVKGAQPDLDATALVIEHDRTMDAEEDARAFDDSGKRNGPAHDLSSDDAEQDITDRKSPDDRHDDNHNAAVGDTQDPRDTQDPEGQEDNERTERAHDDDVTDNNSRDHRQQVEQTEDTEELPVEIDAQEQNGGRKSRGSDHRSAYVEQEEQEAGYHGDDDNTNSKQQTEEEAGEGPDAEQGEGEAPPEEE